MKTSTRTLGKLLIPRDNYNAELIEKLPKLLILDLMYIYYKDAFALVCSHDSFGEVPLGAEVPTYKILFADDVFYGFEKE